MTVVSSFSHLRTKRDARVGQQQAKLYADCLEKRFGQRPIIFHSNGYEHWIWDDLNYPPRSVQGLYKKDELERLIQRRSRRTSLGAAEINEAIVEPVSLSLGAIAMQLTIRLPTILLQTAENLSSDGNQ